MKMGLLKRELYLSQLRSKRNTPDIKIITGIRRSGKSKLMILYMDYLREIDPDCNIIFIDFRQLEFDSLRDYLSSQGFGFFVGVNFFDGLVEDMMGRRFKGFGAFRRNWNRHFS